MTSTTALSVISCGSPSLIDTLGSPPEGCWWEVVVIEPPYHLEMLAFDYQQGSNLFETVTGALKSFSGYTGVTATEIYMSRHLFRRLFNEQGWSWPKRIESARKRFTDEMKLIMGDFPDEQIMPFAFALGRNSGGPPHPEPEPVD